jgi:hypothetical protein
MISSYGCTGMVYVEKLDVLGACFGVWRPSRLGHFKWRMPRPRRCSDFAKVGDPLGLRVVLQFTITE